MNVHVVQQSEVDVKFQFELQPYRVLQTIQMTLILVCVWAEPAVLGSTKTALKLKYEIHIG